MKTTVSVGIPIRLLRRNPVSVKDYTLDGEMSQSFCTETNLRLKTRKEDNSSGKFIDTKSSLNPFAVS